MMISSTTSTLLIPALMLSAIGAILVVRLLVASIGSLGTRREPTTKKTSTKQRLPPPPGPHRWALPIIGNLPHLMVLAWNLPLHQALCEMSKRYGPLMGFRLGGSRRLMVVSSPDAARLVLQKHDDIFSSRARSVVASIICGSPPTGIGFSDPGPQWKLMRRVCTTQLFSPKSLAGFRPIIYEEVHAMLSAIRDTVGYNSNLVIRNRLHKCTNNIISRMTLGKTLDQIQSSKQHKESFVELLLDSIKYMGENNISDLIPSLAWMDLQGCARRAKDVSMKLNNHLKEVICERRDTMAKSTTPLNVDFLNILLSIKDEDVEVTDDNIVSTLMDMFVGGTDTSSITVEWALAELLANPDKMDLLQSELKRIVGDTKLVDISDLPNLPYLSAVVKETMRMHPVLPLLLPHKLTQSCELLGYEILADTEVYINVWAIGHDPNVWDNPSRFHPQRFLDATSVRGVNFDLLPFGSGRRMCPGMPLGLITTEFLLASLLHSFDWKACSKPKLNESLGIIVRLETPLLVNAYPRLPQ